MLATLKVLLSLAFIVAKFVKDRQLMDAGEAQAVVDYIKGADDAINRARTARAADSVPARDDPYNRDNGPD